MRAGHQPVEGTGRKSVKHREEIVLFYVRWPETLL
jgi:hypothetical protein